jgi:N-acetyltransferase
LTLAGVHVRLEPLMADHVDALLSAAMENREAFRFGGPPASRDRMIAWVELALSEQAAGRQLPFVTRSLEQERIVGATRFHELEPWEWPDGDPHQRRGHPDVCEIGSTWLAGSAQRTGCNTEAKLLMLAHAFEVWEVHRVAFRTDRRNDRSRRAIERLGAQLEGIRRADRPGFDGTIRDSAFYSIIASEWPDVKANLMRRGHRG